jgi:hypothetical protein
MHIHTTRYGETIGYQDARTKNMKTALEGDKKDMIPANGVRVGISMCFGMDGVCVEGRRGDGPHLNYDSFVQAYRVRKINQFNMHDERTACA